MSIGPIDDFLFPVFGAVLAALVSASGGLIATWVSNRFRRHRAKTEADIETIAASVRDERQTGLSTDRVEAILRRELQRPNADLNKAVGTLTTLVHDIVEEKRQGPAIEALISGYHEQALNQSSTQFWFSVTAATIGFGWILYTGLDIRTDDLATVFRTVPGVIMDAVAFLFFKQASETRQRATDLYDRLRRDKQSTDSIMLVESIEDVRVRSAVKAQMALHMSGLEPSPINLTQFLSTGTIDASDSSPAKNAVEQPFPPVVHGPPV
jgi:hypothetical protein